jgi:hypothetical protein
VDYRHGLPCPALYINYFTYFYLLKINAGEGGRVKWGEMTHTLYAHMNKRKNK